jgi:hypothetical protein
MFNTGNRIGVIILTTDDIMEIKKPTANSTFAIVGVSCSADSLVVKESSVLRINICDKRPAHRKSAKRYAACFRRNHSLETA